MGWLLIYKDGNVHDLVNTNGKVFTHKTIYNCSSEEDCFNKVDELQLTYEGLSGGTMSELFSGGTRTILPY